VLFKLIATADLAHLMRDDDVDGFQRHASVFAHESDTPRLLFVPANNIEPGPRTKSMPKALAHSQDQQKRI
jgi:hypothetical protein